MQNSKYEEQNLDMLYEAYVLNPNVDLVWEDDELFLKDLQEDLENDKYYFEYSKEIE